MVTLLYQQTFYEMIHTLYNQQTLQMYVICESMCPGPLGMCQPDIRNLTYLRIFYNRYMLMYPTDSLKCAPFSDITIPDETVDWLKLWWCGMENF